MSSSNDGNTSQRDDIGIMSSNSQQWKRTIEKIDEHLAQWMAAKGVYGISLTSYPGTGKSTVLVQHIWELSKTKKAPGKVVYVVPTKTDVALIGTWLRNCGSVSAEDAGDRQVRSDNPFTLCSVIGWFEVLQEAIWDTDTDRTVIIDVSWYPTVMEEIAFSLLVLWIRRVKAEVAKGKDVRVVVVLLMSTFESTRTVNWFHRHLDAVIRFNCTNPAEFPYPKLDVEPLEAGWKAKIGQVVKEVLDQGGRVVLGTDQWRKWESFRQHESNIGSLPALETSDELRIIKDAPILSLDPLLPYSTRVDNMRLFLTLGVAEDCNILLREYAQVVKVSRNLEWCEMLRQYSWVVKSAGEDNIRVLGRTIGETPPEDTRSVEKLSPAWNRDLMFLVLATMQAWPHKPITRIPIRMPINQQAFDDTMRRLYILDCIKYGDEQDRTVECTGLGMMVMTIYCQDESDDIPHDFHATYLFARTAQNLGSAPEVVRVIIRIAALVKAGLDAFCKEGQAIDSEALKELCPPLIRGRFNAGAIWFFLAMYLQYESMDAVAKEYIKGKTWFPRGLKDWAVMPDAMEKVAELVHGMEEMARLNEVDNPRWIDEPLSESQLQYIDEELMWAWMHRIAIIDDEEDASDIKKIYDCVAWNEMQVDMSKEPLQATTARSYCERVSEGKAIHVFFMSLNMLTNGPSRGRVQANYLTWLPPKAFENIPKQTGLTWPGVIGATY